MKVALTVDKKVWREAEMMEPMTGQRKEHSKDRLQAALMDVK